VTANVVGISISESAFGYCIMLAKVSIVLESCAFIVLVSEGFVLARKVVVEQARVALQSLGLF